MNSHPGAVPGEVARGWLTQHRPREATWVVFFVAGAVIGTWAAQIPAIRDRLEISTGAVSLCILGMGIATVVAGLLAGHVLGRGSAVGLTRAGVVVMPISGALVLVAPSLGTLALAMGLLGATFGLLDVSMNAHGVAIQEEMGTAIMSSLHGGWSVGGLVGGGAVAAGQFWGLDPRLEGVAFLAVLIGVGVWFGGHIDSGAEVPEVPEAPDERPEPGGGWRIPWPTAAILLLGSLALLIFATEGTVLDWSSLYISQDLGGGDTLAAAAVGVFSGGMTVGRLLGDPVSRAIGSGSLLRAGSLLAACALIAMVLLGHSAIALPALFLTGVGVANGAPLLVSAAGANPRMPPGAAIAATAMMGNMGTLVVAPLLGVVAQFSSLGVALAIAGVLAAMVGLGAPLARR